MTAEASPMRNDATMSDRARENAARKPEPLSIGPGAPDATPGSSPTVNAMMKPRASGTIATMRGNEPTTPVALTSSGPRNCAPV